MPSSSASKARSSASRFGFSEPQWASLVVDLSLLALLCAFALAPGCSRSVVQGDTGALPAATSVARSAP
jgi:hypothetical protein